MVPNRSGEVGSMWDMKRLFMSFFLVCLFFLLSFPVFAETVTLETDVTLYPPSGVFKIQEFGVGPSVQRVKVTPIVGPSYYLVPARGTRYFDNTGASFKPVVHIAEWVLWEW